ncbi:MAG: hypothetical protein IR160_02080 [Salinibacterium sp.]|nr:hypothetical protein [Salinibacterium sp.]MBF0671356.1 hypothetical protein [Salinibacterium sp.]
MVILELAALMVDMNDYRLTDNLASDLATLRTDSPLADNSIPAGVPASFSTGEYYLSCSPQIVAEVEHYRSAQKQWPKVRHIVRDAVARTAEARTLSAKTLMRIVGPFALWCVTTRRIQPDPQHLFTQETIDAYCLSLTLSAGTVATYRSALTTTARTVNALAYAPAPTPLPKRTVQPPYRETELDEYRAWAGAQRTEQLKQKARVMIALMAGAGLSPIETTTLRVEDVGVDGDGVLLTVHGSKPRQVAVLHEWEQWVIESVAEREPSDFVWGAAQRRVRPNQISEFIHAATAGAPASQRLRATWIVTHLGLGTPLTVLFRAGGIAQLDNLDQYLVHVPTRSDPESRTLLRGPRRVGLFAA